MNIDIAEGTVTATIYKVCRALHLILVAILEAFRLLSPVHHGNSNSPTFTTHTHTHTHTRTRTTRTLTVDAGVFTIAASRMPTM
jgi:hypothetical protein